MKRTLGLFLLFFISSCAKHEVGINPLEEQALIQAAQKCQNEQTLDWLRELIALSEVDLSYKGYIYAIQYSSGTVFLHQPWISSCLGCNLYGCGGGSISLTEGERNEVIAGLTEANIIYTSSR